MNLLCRAALLTAAIMIFAINPAWAEPFAEPNQFGEGFDRETCLQECREMMGDLLFRGGRGGSIRGGYQDRYTMYARCVQECEKKFWKEFDRQFKDE